MNCSRHVLTFCLTAVLIPLICVAAVYAQDDIGPEAVWTPDQSTWSAYMDCSPANDCTLSSFMAGQGAPTEAVAFTQSRDDSYYLSSFTELGRVDLGVVTMPLTASGIGLYELLNGNPSPISAEDVSVDEMRVLPAYAAIWARHPNLVLWAQTIYDGMEARPDGGQRFLFSYPMLDGCRACPEIDKARAAFDFDAAGNFLGITYLDPASVAPVTAQPPAAPGPPPSSGPSAALDQIAYTVPTGEMDGSWGNLWIIDLAGGGPRQITSGGIDCCAAWSPDGMRVYFIRYIDGEAQPMSIFELDMGTGAERAIGPETTLAGTLAVSPDGQTLAFVTNSPMPPPGPEDFILIDNVACLNLLELDSGDIRQIDCLEQSFMGDLEFNPHEPTLIVGAGGMEWAEIYVYDLFPSEPTAFQGVCCFAPEWSANDIRLYTIGNDYYMFDFFRIGGIDGWGIFEHGQGLSSPRVVVNSVEPINSIDLSPDDQMIAYERVGRIELAMVGDPSLQPDYVAAGLQPVWRPGDPAAWVATHLTPSPDDTATVLTGSLDATSPGSPGVEATAVTAVTEIATATLTTSGGSEIIVPTDRLSEEAIAMTVTASPATSLPAAGSGSDGILIGIIVVSAAAALFGIIGYLTRRKT